MKYSAIQFMQADFAGESHCAVAVGNNRWLKRQVREKIQSNYGVPQVMDCSQDGTLREIASIVSSSTLFPGKQQYIYAIEVQPEDLYKWLEKIDISSNNTFLLFDLSVKKADARVTQAQLKKLAKYDKDKTISYIDCHDPTEDIALKIIGRLLPVYEIKEKKYVSIFFKEYGFDFDSCEENAKKAQLNGGISHKLFDKRETSIKDVWRFVDEWIGDNIKAAIATLESIDRRIINEFALHSQICRQFRQYILALETGKGHPSVVQRCGARPQKWLTSTYFNLLGLNPIHSNYIDSLKRVFISSFS